MKHLGDITKIDGSKIEPVDIITFGSPCQDLSVAGKREGLSGERSGLFMEAIRVIKEMRNVTAELSMRGTNDDIRLSPSTAIWENVPGAFSSGSPKGADFRCVLEELARVKDPQVSIPMPKKWMPAGCIEGDNWSLAWRTHDAQYWGVPQRRRRISVVARFDDTDAANILFQLFGESDNSETDKTLTSAGNEPGQEILAVSESLSGDIAESREPGEEVTGTVGQNFEGTISFQERAGKPGGGKGILIQNDRVGSMGTSPNQYVCSLTEDVQKAEVICVDQGGGKSGANFSIEQSPTLTTTHQGEPAVCYGLDRASFNQGQNAKYDISIQEEIAQPIVARGPGGVMQTR